MECLVLTLTLSNAEYREHNDSRKFPDGFLFGAATAAYQIEGAWNVDGKSESIWDFISHLKPCIVKNCDTGDISDNSYYQYKRDVEMMRELGLDYYRFSISWTRILPSSFPNIINKAGKDYYNNLINEMLQYNITPMVTMYHGDLPLKLQKMGGWMNPYISDWFSDYARVLFKLFGDRVKHWFTINEPKEICYQDFTEHFKNLSGIADYICSKNLLVAHGKAYQIYDREFKSLQNGTVGIVLSSSWYEPETETDAEAAEDAAIFELGRFAYPIFSKNGDFPERMKARIANKSAEQGFPRSRLPEFTPEEIAMIKGSADFFSLNHYSSVIVYRNESVNGYYNSPSYQDDMGIRFYLPSNWTDAGEPWLKMVPWGFHKLLTKIRKDYNNPPIFVTENGCASRKGLNDETRVTYYKSYLNAMLDAIDEGSDIRVYTAWSIMDNFEWMQGYDGKFGLYEVDFESPERTRTARKSAYLYKEILRTRTLDMHFEPNISLPMTIDEGH